ncbi:uncharacterized protein GGS22DRAFT_79851 [Annulohypoxylon maeteangense]|uniref:uncharacterized protein n=1 Tax=Annulohypoxylon maeteangense TaxID=1927788 RepID=UPI0020086954|nr:uncharacterized protein GGS22DRAFT_79851 [Annulohypoxylon maeteangense]KAI0880765.1 hypothetical protein GGS22DRAFT_79851 [Annulohypoxylon maeteangense]
MSSQPKITSKNLSYSTDLPPFLAKLRGQQERDRNSDSPDPILAARRRAARPRSASEEAEDAPLVVDEAGNTITFPSAADADDHKTIDGVIDGGDAENTKENRKEKEREKVAAIGASKKRKVGRVVGGDEEEEPNGTTTTTTTRSRIEKESSSKSKDKKESKNTADSNSKDAKSGSKQGKKKAKKIKLSFGDDGD